MVLDTSLLNTQQYKVVEQSRESSALGVVAIEKGSYGSPATIVANITWIVWNSTVFDIESILTLNWIV